MGTIVVTNHMLDAGYTACKNVAQKYGYGWTFDMISQGAVRQELAAIFKAMASAAPTPMAPAAIPAASPTPAPSSKAPAAAPAPAPSSNPGDSKN